MIFTELSSEYESESITIGEDIDIFNAVKIVLLGKGSPCTVAGLFIPPPHSNNTVYVVVFLFQ